MRYHTHQFAHPETLDRAWRWLIQAGISPDRMQVQHHGVPRMAVALELDELDGIEMVIHAAEMNDPDEPPSIWDVARPEPAELATSQEIASPTPIHRASFTLAWHPVDAAWDHEFPSPIEREKDHRKLRP
jgi:hypothetical protein